MKNLIYIFVIINFLISTACQPKEKNIEKETSLTKHLAFIGTYTRTEGHVDGRGMGVGMYSTDANYENWELKNSFSEIVNPSFICHSPMHPIIYAVSEGGEQSTIRVLSYNSETYKIKEIQSISSLGNDPCHISVDRDGKFLWVANYGTGNVIQYKIKNDGSLMEGIAHQHHGTGPKLDRQEGPHAHFIGQHPSRPEVYAVDLGADKVYGYLITDAGLVMKDSLQVTPGGGCRHLNWHPRGNHVYILNELNGMLELWEWHGSVKERLQIIPLPDPEKEGYPGSGAIDISKNGQYLYASLRGDYNEVVVMKLDSETYKMEIIQRIPSIGSTPRFMNLTPDEKILTVAIQDEDFILLYKRNPKTGMLSDNPQKIDLKSPVCVVYK